MNTRVSVVEVRKASVHYVGEGRCINLVTGIEVPLFSPTKSLSDELPLLQGSIAHSLTLHRTPTIVTQIKCWILIVYKF